MDEVLDNFLKMATTVRHNKIMQGLTGSIFGLARKKELHALSEECSLVYWGEKRAILDDLRLVDISEIDDTNHFRESVIEDLYYVQPDLMVFKDNPYVENKRQTKTAGQPDLIVEVWSDGNSRKNRAFLHNLYATSDITEHWYIEQDKNEVICYLGCDRIDNQYLTDVLVSRGGLEFDLRYLAI